MSERPNVFGVDRRVWDHPVLAEPRKSFTRIQAWIWLVSEAAWKSRRVRPAGKIFTLHRGQLAHSIRFMATAWRWEQTKVVRFLSDLKNETMIATDKSNGITVTTICNYEKYQVVGLPKLDGIATGDATETQQERNSGATNEKQVNKETSNTAAVEGSDGRVLEAIGVLEDPRWDIQRPRILSWTTRWDIDLDILPTVRKMMLARNGDPPKTAGYFEGAIAEQHARRMAPLPVVVIDNPEVIHARPNQTARGGSVLDAVDRLKAKMQSGDGFDGGAKDFLRLPKG